MKPLYQQTPALSEEAVREIEGYICGQGTR